MGIRASSRFQLIQTPGERRLASFAEEVSRGLDDRPRHIPCRFLYDEEGSRIFEEICELPEYYLTRAEHEILRAQAAAIAGVFDGPITLAELGSGSSTKTRVLIEALLRAHGRLRYVPVDISQSMLEESALELLERYDGLEVRAIASEYREGLRHVRADDERKRLVVWLGSSIGNLGREEAGGFLAAVRRSLRDCDRLLVGIDLRKGRRELEAAYDDAAGVTARFSLNLLERANRELLADFDTRAFRHRAVYLEDEGRIVIDLVSLRPQRVGIAALRREVGLAAGEAIHVENSFKYSPAEIRALAHTAGLAVQEHWLDAAGRFSLNLLAPR
jgi:dimethylhistidine N-methyltransferase